MKWSWQQLLPVDGFYVRMTEYLAETDMKSLMLLYQPLIGGQAVNLYHTLAQRLKRDVYQCDGASHYELMITTGQQLPEILEVRRKLEAIGLLRTFVQKKEDERCFMYELLSPLSPKHFFEDDVLSVFLYNRIGKRKYRELRQQFSYPVLKEEWEETTAAFDEVYTSLHPSELIPSIEQRQEQTSDRQPLSAALHKGITLKANDFDFELLYTTLPTFLDRNAILTEPVKKAVKRLAFVYRVDPISMGHLLQQSLAGDEDVDITLFRKKVQEWYRMAHGQMPPALGLRSQENSGRKEEEQPEGEVQQSVKYFETTSPLTLLESLSDGAVVPLADARLAESLLFDYQLPPGVTNILIDYVMRTNDRRLDAPLVQKIAGHWSRKKLKTVEDAMELAKQEYKKRQAAKMKSGGTTNSKGEKSRHRKPQTSRSTYKERLPKWLTGEIKEASDEEKRKRAGEEQKKFEALLQQYRKG